MQVILHEEIPRDSFLSKLQFILLIYMRNNNKNKN